MKITASIQSKFNDHQTSVQTNGAIQEIQINPKATGFGSSVNGGELLLLSLATCFCDNIYREAAKRNINISSLLVEVTGDFETEGLPGSNFKYKASIESDAPAADIEELISYTDETAEVHNTLRQGIRVTLIKVRPITVSGIYDQIIISIIYAFAKPSVIFVAPLHNKF